MVCVMQFCCRGRIRIAQATVELLYFALFHGVAADFRLFILTERPAALAVLHSVSQILCADSNAWQRIDRIVDNGDMKRDELFILPVVVLLLGTMFWFFAGQDQVIKSATKPMPMAWSGSEWNVVAELMPVADLSPEKVALGARLFRDKRLSADQSVSCFSCHDLGKGGVDGRQVSRGVKGAEGVINAPSVLNAAYNFAQFWDGRALSLEEQAAGPIHSPLEMGSSWSEVINRLRGDPEIVAQFERLYPDGLRATNIADAIATFERSLVTVNSPFDRYLKGDSGAITPLAREGFERFQELGCASCHQGVLLGGNMYQRFGILKDYFESRRPSKADLGRYNVTGREDDKYVFKVPSLRNVALTAPYFHDGSESTLERAVLVMGQYQLGRDLSQKDIRALVAFLYALTGEVRQ